MRTATTKEPRKIRHRAVGRKEENVIALPGPDITTDGCVCQGLICREIWGKSMDFHLLEL
jgi:hypothetical protein